jgi:hypothetical protein
VGSAVPVHGARAAALTWVDWSASDADLTLPGGPGLTFQEHLTWSTSVTCQEQATPLMNCP